MSGLTIFLTDTERDDIKIMLERLFTFQDRPAGKDKVALFLEEIIGYGFPFPAIMAGLKSMMEEDYRSVKLAHILNAIRNKIIPEEMNFADCKFCDRTGMISMVRQDHYSFAFACQCDRGRKYKDSMGLIQWNGKKVQIAHNKTFTIHETHVIGAGGEKQWFG